MPTLIEPLRTQWGDVCGAAETLPKATPEQLRVLREAPAERPHTTESLAELFKRKPRKSVEEGLLSLVAVGRAEHEQGTDTWYGIVW